MTIISFEINSNKSTRDKKKKHFSFNRKGIHYPRVEFHYKIIKKKKKKKAIKKDLISRSSPVGDLSRS